MGRPRYFVLEIDLNTQNIDGTDKTLFFDGYMISEEEFFISSDVKIGEINRELVPNATGEFLFIQQRQTPGGTRTIEVATDLFGFYSAFYHIEDSKLTISNSFKALKVYLTNKGAKLTLNIEYLTPLVISSYTFFSYPYALQTAIKEIAILPADQLLQFSDSGVQFSSKFEIDTSDADYESLLEIGLETCKRKIIAFNERFKNNFKKLYMSGGKDSRAALAVLLSAVSNRDFYLHSNNPEKMNPNVRDHMLRDLIIANKIALLLGLKVCEKEPEVALKRISLTFSQSLEGWQNDFSNARFNFQPTFYAYEYDGSDFKIQFRGAGGEMYRGYWSEVIKGFTTTYKNIKNTRATISQDADLVFAALVPSRVVSPEIYSAARNVFRNAVASMAGNTFMEKIDQHYNFLRHRFHFGHGNRGLRTAELMYLPLIDKHFYLASRCLSNTEKAAGKMIFDIVDRLSPYLNLIEYDSSVWSNSQLGQSKYLKNAKILEIPDFVGGNTHKPGVITENREFPNVASAIGETAATYNRSAAVEAKVLENLEYLKSHPQSAALFTESVVNLCITRLKKHQQVNILLGKTESIRDAIDAIQIEFETISLMS